MKKQLGFVALAMVASAAAFAQAVPPQSIPIKVNFDLLDQGCVINPVDSSLAVNFGNVDSQNLAAAALQTVYLKYTACKPDQLINLAASTTTGAPGSADGRLALAAGAGNAEGIEIQFNIGASNVALPVGGAAVYVAKNASPTLPQNVSVPLKAKVVAVPGGTIVDGAINANLILTASY